MLLKGEKRVGDGMGRRTAYDYEVKFGCLHFRGAVGVEIRSWARVQKVM